MSEALPDPTPLPSGAGGVSYGGYLRLDRLLAAQQPLSPAPDEMLFIIQHQTTELWMKLVIHELRSAMAALRADRLPEALRTLGRVGRVLEHMNDAWDVLRTMTPSEFAVFRDGLGQSSGFQSWQYRAIEFLVGNRNPGLLRVHADRPDDAAALAAILAEPSLYDEALQVLTRHGFDIADAGQRAGWRDGEAPDRRVTAAWQAVYADPGAYRPLYELAERLVDIEDCLRRWRFNHVTTVERIIGMKRGTGSTAGVPYLRRLLEVVLFPELWGVRTQL